MTTDQTQYVKDYTKLLVATVLMNIYQHGERVQKERRPKEFSVPNDIDSIDYLRKIVTSMYYCGFPNTVEAIQRRDHPIPNSPDLDDDGIMKYPLLEALHERVMRIPNPAEILNSLFIWVVYKVSRGNPNEDLQA